MSMTDIDGAWLGALAAQRLCYWREKSKAFRRGVWTVTNRGQVTQSRTVLIPLDLALIFKLSLRDRLTYHRAPGRVLQPDGVKRYVRRLALTVGAQERAPRRVVNVMADSGGSSCRAAQFGPDGQLDIGQSPLPALRITIPRHMADWARIGIGDTVRWTYNRQARRLYIERWDAPLLTKRKQVQEVQRCQ